MITITEFPARTPVRWKLCKFKSGVKIMDGSYESGIRNNEPGRHLSGFSLDFFKKGFTLIELLVVITILGLLAGLVLSNMSSARERARDTKRKSDLKEIQKALQMYKQDNNSLYPEDLSDLTVDGKYMRTIPSGPLDGETYFYDPSDDYTDYVLRACLENVSDPQGEPDATNCPSLKFELSAP